MLGLQAANPGILILYDNMIRPLSNYNIIGTYGRIGEAAQITYARFGPTTPFFGRF